MSVKKIINNNSHLIIRSSIAPGTFRKIFKALNKNNDFTNLSYCPERVLQGQSMIELSKIPQIISSYNLKTLKHVKKLFSKLCKTVSLQT